MRGSEPTPSPHHRAPRTDISRRSRTTPHSEKRHALGAIRARRSGHLRNRRGRIRRNGRRHALRRMAPVRRPPSPRRPDLAAAGRTSDVLLRRPELRRAHPDGGEAPRCGARASEQAGCGLPCPERTDRSSSSHRASAERDGPGGVRRRAGVRRRTHREAPHAGRRARVPPRVHHRQRRERTLVAGGGPGRCGGRRTPTRSSRWARGSRPTSTSTRP